MSKQLLSTRSRGFRYKFKPIPFLSLLIITFALMTSCREPIDLKFPSEQSKIVVDGFITNISKQHSVKVSFSSGFSEQGSFEPRPVTNAVVEIEDDLGQTISLTHSSQGEYLTPVFQAEEGRSYKVEVILDGQSYESSFQSLPEFQSTANINFKLSEREILSNGGAVVDQPGISLFAQLEQVDEPVYYQWLQRHYYVWEARRHLQIFPDGNRFCFVRDFDRIQVDLVQSAPGNQTTNIELDFFLTTEKMWHEYGIEVIQLITNAESHDYWEQIQRQSENTGSLFDSAPATIVGNIKNITGSPVLGFFGVYNQSNDYVFFNNCELPLRFRRNLLSCPTERTEVEAKMSPCYDCLKKPGVSSEIRQPSWWRTIFPPLDSPDRQVCPGNF